MNTLTLDNAAIMEAVVARLVDEFRRTDDQLYDEVEKRISKKIDALFLKSVEPRIQKELDRALPARPYRQAALALMSNPPLEVVKQYGHRQMINPVSRKTTDTLALARRNRREGL